MIRLPKSYSSPLMAQTYGPEASSNYVNAATVNLAGDYQSLVKYIGQQTVGNLANAQAGSTGKFGVKVRLPRVRTFDIENVTPDGIDLNKYAWNLPPHTWSRPVEPSDLTRGMTADTSNWDRASDDIDRRGRIYWYSRVDTDVLKKEANNTGTAFGSAGASVANFAGDPRYGFQFLWNPEKFSTNVSVNMDITPNANDAFLKVVGAFPSGETLTVEVAIDRTNDFMCLRSIGSDQTSRPNAAVLANRYSRYYYARAWSDSKSTIGEKLVELMNYGTLSDIEYLYKAINGPGWKNPAAGRNTSDIGFLMPTLLKIEIGPSKYIGYVSNLQIDHLRFTKAMIPMSSLVKIQFNLMATAGIASGGKVYG